MNPTAKDWATAGPPPEDEEVADLAPAPAPEDPRERDLPLPVVRVGNVARSPAKFGKVSGKASAKGPGRSAGTGPVGRGKAGARGTKVWAKGKAKAEEE